MKHPLMPDYIYNKFDDVSVDFLKSKGIKAVVLDVDNTLEPYEHPTPGPRVINWLKNLSDEGIRCAIVSNNNKKRITIFNEQLALPAYPKAGKPFTRCIRRALKTLNADPSCAAMMGDQIFTDVWAANSAGLLSILVSPIRDKKNILTRVKRMLEKPILKKYYKYSTKKTENS